MTLRTFLGISSVLPLALMLVGCTADTDPAPIGEGSSEVYGEYGLACPRPGEIVSGVGYKQLGGRSYDTFFRAAAFLHNVGYRKRVGAVYTTDHWATSKVAEMHLGAQQTRCGADVELWALPDEFGIPIAGPGTFYSTTIEFAVFYDDLEHGATHWDNNGGSNYVAH